MPNAGHNALLHRPRIWASAQHFQVVVGFEHQRIARAKMYFDAGRHVSQVGRHADLDALGAENESDGISRVMRDGEREHLDVADGEALARAEVLAAIEVSFIV